MQQARLNILIFIATVLIARVVLGDYSSEVSNEFGSNDQSDDDDDGKFENSIFFLRKLTKPHKTTSRMVTKTINTRALLPSIHPHSRNFLTWSCRTASSVMVTVWAGLERSAKACGGQSKAAKSLCPTPSSVKATPELKRQTSWRQ
jgi:hypothetical protein